MLFELLWLPMLRCPAVRLQFMIINGVPPVFAQRLVEARFAGQSPAAGGERCQHSPFNIFDQMESEHLSRSSRCALCSLICTD